MSSPLRRVDDDSDDAPEEFTSEQGLQQHLEITKAQQQSVARAHHEKKERRKKWAQRLTPRAKPQTKAPKGDDDEMVEDEQDDDTNKQSQVNTGMLPNDIVNLLAAREKQVFLSDSEEERAEKRPKGKKKRTNISGVETVILRELPASHCVEKSLEFLKKRKMQVARSSAVLTNSNQALRLLSSSGLLK